MESGLSQGVGRSGGEDAGQVDRSHAQAGAHRIFQGKVLARSWPGREWLVWNLDLYPQGGLVSCLLNAELGGSPTTVLHRISSQALTL